MTESAPRKAPQAGTNQASGKQAGAEQTSAKQTGHLSVVTGMYITKRKRSL